MGYETLIYEVQQAIATVTLNRPQVLHALNTNVFDELETVFTDIGQNPSIRVALLTGAGDKAFAAGADIKELAATDAVTGTAKARRGQTVFSQIETCSKPVIALINGFALGGGCELAMACTLRLAGERAKLGQPEIKLGLIPGYGGTQRLPRLVGASLALRMLLTGEIIGAEEALRIGLVDELVPGEGREPLQQRGLALAQTIAGMPPLAVSGCLEVVRRSARLQPIEGMEHEAEIFGRLCATEDKAEGTAAFLEKRAPVWTGR
jgi:enoyl-CoA hydratase